ncbi:MAG TPA: hypothetical protein VE988_19800 [Gemmataceae bacterium]|nr:hypothetical protein [Gemmataceae bacterium]
MFPLIPLLAILAMVGGGATLAWYSELSKEEKEEADRIACGYAADLYQKGLKELTKAEAAHVSRLTASHFKN